MMSAEEWQNTPEYARYLADGLVIEESEETACELFVCQSCMLLTANGECDPEDVEAIAGYERWHSEHSDWHLALGGDHNDQCTPVDRQEGCDCDQIGFSWSTCEVCGVSSGGDRFKLTAFRK